MLITKQQYSLVKEYLLREPTSSFPNFVPPPIHPNISISTLAPFFIAVEMTIITTAEVEERLTQYNIPFAKASPLDGGSANFVWRIVSPEGATSIIKHAEPYARDTPNDPYNTDRMNFENLALQILPQIIPRDDVLQFPAVQFYEGQDKILQLSDSGPRTLKTAYADRMLNVPVLGKRIGKWLARLHASTRGPDARGIFQDNTGKDTYRHVYVHSPAIFSEWGHDASVVEAINKEYWSRFQSDSECVCHGDFWPGNIVVQSAVSYGSSNHKLTVVDWENVRDGGGATDVAQFASEAWLLDRFKGGRGLFCAFLSGYAEGTRESGGEVGEEFKLKVAAHFGPRECSILTLWKRI
jgi:5-methylthioribose kinase